MQGIKVVCRKSTKRLHAYEFSPMHYCDCFLFSVLKCCFRNNLDDLGQLGNWTKSFHCLTRSGANKRAVRGTSKRASEWPSTYVPILLSSESLCTGRSTNYGSVTLRILFFLFSDFVSYSSDFQCNSRRDIPRPCTPLSDAISQGPASVPHSADVDVINVLCLGSRTSTTTLLKIVNLPFALPILCISADFVDVDFDVVGVAGA